MTKITITSNLPQAIAAFDRAPEVMLSAIGDRLHRGAKELARHIRTNTAPKGATSTLTHSIRDIVVGPAHFGVVAGVEYAAFVHEGTGPGGYPSIPTIRDWIRLKGIRAHDGDERALPYRIRRSIGRKGIKANPFMQRGLEEKTDRLRQLLDEGAALGLQRLGEMT